MRRIIPILVIVGLVLSSCGEGGQPVATLSPDDLVERGALVYAANCAECHGADLRGTDRGPSLLSQVYEPGHHGDGAFQAAVARGSPEHHWDFGPMPPVPGLSIDDVEAVVALVRRTQQTHGFEPYPP